MKCANGSVADRSFFTRAGELVEKSTRVLTEEEKAQLEVPFVGKNGEKRKVEVSAAMS